MIYSNDTIDALCEAWNAGLDYIEIQGVNFAMYPDGIWEINDSCILDEGAKVILVYKPSKPWGNLGE